MKLFFIHVKWAVLAFLLLAVMPHANAQNYPVQATVALNPPYSPRLSTLGTETQALTIQLLHKDFATPATSVYLQFKLEGAGITIETVNTYKSPAAFALTAGIPLSVSGTDIADLFDANNLNFLGIAKNAYLSGGQKIPQGIYRFSFRALDQSTGLPVSNWGSFSTSIFGQLPPIINTPADGSEQTAQDPQFLNIQFTPRHTNYPALLGNVRYKIRLIELQPANRNANEAMQSVQVPLFETITDQTFYNYGASEPQLVFGRSYALMVQVIDATGAEQFENNGNSQVVAFVYGSKCPSPTGLVANPQTGAGATLSWDAHDMHRAYGVSYRKKGSWAWQEQMVFGTGFTISNLQPASIYEFKVWGICAESESNPSPVILLRTDTLKSGYETWAAKSCGKPLPTIDLKNRAPLALLQAGDKILAADFTVTVLSANGGNGKYSGTGLVKLPFTGSVPIPCNFEQVGINTDFRLIEGSIRLLRKPLELSNRSLKSLADNWQQRFGDNWNRFETKTYPGDIRNISVNPNGDIEVEGNTGTQKFSGGKNLEFVDASGNSWFVSPAGRVTKSEGKRMQPPVVEEIKTGKGMPNSIPTGQSKVFFTCGNHQGYDGYEIRELTAGLDYDKLKCGDTAYNAGWKLLTAGNADTIVANFTPGRKINIPADSVFFARSDGTLVPFIRQGNQFKLVVFGRMNLYCDAIWAMAYTGHLGYGGPKTTVLGKLNLISVDLRKIHIKLIPINGVGLSANEGELSNKLNALLSKQGLFYEVSKSKNIQVGNYNEKTAKIKINRSVLNTSYGGELSEFIGALETRDPWVSTYQGIDTAYMFMLSQAENNEDGYMALNRNYGFVFLNGSGAPKPHVLAHETAHGLLNLEHVFSDEKNAGYSQNLMDYSPPFTLFHKDQWMLVFDNKKWGAQKLKLSQDEKRGKLLGGKLFSLEELKIPTKGAISFVAPDGKPITLQADSIDGVSFTGTYFASGTNMLSKRAAQANGTLTKVQYGGVYYYAKFYMGKYLGFVPAESPQSNRFDIPYYHPFAYSNSVAVYAGYEDTTCSFTIRSGNYANTNYSDTAIRYVNLTTESEIHQIDMGEECLEYFTEELLTPAAKRWWNLAKLNSNFVKNTNACRRIVRLIHDLGNDYKYFDLESYKSYLAKVKPKISPPFSDPIDPFTEKGLRSFENYLRASYEGLVSHEMFFGNISDAQELGTVLSTMPKGILEQLSLPLRMKLLRKLTNAGLTNLGFYYGMVFLRESDNESVTWALIHTLPDNQVKDFLDSIISLIPSHKSPHLLAAWSNDILGLDGEEYYRFVSWMFRAIAKHYPPKDDWDMLEALEDNQLLSFNPGIAQGTVEYDYKTDGKISLETLAVPDTKPIQTTLHPYDWTYLKFLDNFEFSGKEIKENSTLKIPAAIVAGIFDKENTNDAFTSAELVLDIALFAVGIGEVKAALEVGNLARKAWLASKAVADLGLSLGDIIITGGLGEQLDKTASGRAFLSRWNNIQLYYGIGSLAETGLSKLVYRLYDDYKAVKTWDNLDPKLQKELDGMVGKVEDFTGLKRIENLKLRAGKKIIGEQNLIQADVPISKFKKLRAVESEQIVAYSARDFWLEEGTDFVQYLSEDAEYLIKHDPSTGRMLVADVQSQEVVYFSLDEDKMFVTKLPAQDDAAYKELMLKTRTHLGLSGGLKEITIRGKKMVFSQDKANVLLGKFQARYVQGIEGQELGTEEVMEELLMFKHYSHKDLDFELRPGSVQVLNVPNGSILKTKELTERVGAFWDAYNLNFLDMIVSNKSRVNVVLVSDPRKEQVLNFFNKIDKEFSGNPTIFAKEIKYLRDREIKTASLVNGSILNLDLISLNNLNWVGWKY